jgi:hypothetical protein
MGYTNEFARLALSFAGSESGVVCRVVLLSGCEAENSLIHTFLVAIYAHLELQRKAVFGFGSAMRS